MSNEHKSNNNNSSSSSDENENVNNIASSISLNIENFHEIIEKFKQGVEIIDRTYHLRKYEKCFVGREAVAFMIQDGIVLNEQDAISLGNMLMNADVFRHVTREHTFKNEYLFYRLTEHETSKGAVPKKDDGSAFSWSDFLPKYDNTSELNVQPSLSEYRRVDRKENMLPQHFDQLEISPLDEHNARLLDHVHPVQWVDPDGNEVYNILVIGAGAGGLVTAAGSAGVGARVALIEKHLLGGDCLNVGCVPSKALLKSAAVAHQIRHAYKYGIKVNDFEVDFPTIMSRLRKIRADISPNDSAKRFTNDLGVDVYFGEAKFTSPYTVTVNGKTLKFKKAVIATGGSAALPNIIGLQQIPYHTNATIFNLTQLPSTLVVIGAGPIGCELAQAFQRFGSRVYVIVRSDRILTKEDPQAAAVVQNSMTNDGVTFVMNAKITHAQLLQSADAEQKSDFPQIKLTVKSDKGESELITNVLLIAAGRRANVANLGLEAAEVSYDQENGVTVNDFLQTSQKHIFAVGDCASKYQFTHMADFMARLVIRNALFFGRSRVSQLIVPWATYTDPEIAHVGLYEEDLQERNIAFRVFQREFAHVDRAIVEDRQIGFVKIFTAADKDTILGATIVGPNASDMISEVTVAIQHRIGLSSLATVIHPYPTNAEAVRQCGDAFNRTRLTSMVKGLFRHLMDFQRK